MKGLIINESMLVERACNYPAERATTGSFNRSSHLFPVVSTYDSCKTGDIPLMETRSSRPTMAFLKYDDAMAVSQKSNG